MIGNFFSRLGNAFVFIFILMLVLIGFFPSMISSDWGKKQIVEWMNLSIPGKVTIDHLNFQWGKGQSIKGISLLSAEGQTVLRIKKITTEASLWDLLFPRTDMGAVEVSGLNGHITSNAQGITNLQKALGLPYTSFLTSPNDFSLSNVSFHLNGLNEQKAIVGVLKGETAKNNEKGSFDIHFALQSVKKKKWEEVLTDLTKNGGKNLHLDIVLDNVAVELLDELMSLYLPAQRGLLDALFGEKMNLRLKKENQLSLDISSSHLTTSLKGLIENNRMTLQEPANLSLTITPEFFRFFFPHLELNTASQLSSSFETLSIPLSILDDLPLNPCLFGFQGMASISSLDLRATSGESLLIEEVAVDINAPLCDKKVVIDVNGKAGDSKLQGSIGFEKPKRFLDILDRVNGYFELSRFPLFLLSRDQQAMLGKELDLKLEIASSLSGNQAIVSLKSNSLQVNQAHFLWNRGISLEKPLELIWSLPKDQKGLIENLELKIEKFNFPVGSLAGRDFVLDFSLKDLVFRLPNTDKNILLKNFHSINRGKQLDKIHADLSGELALFDGSPLLENLNFINHSIINFSSFGKIATIFSKMQIKSEEMDLVIEADYHPPFLSTKKPLEFHYQLSPEKLEKIKQFIGIPFPKIQRNAGIDCKISPMTLDLSQPLLSNLETKGEIVIDELNFQSESVNAPLIEEMNLGWNINTTKKLFALNMDALAYDGEALKPGQVEAYAQLENWLEADRLNFEKLITEVQVDLTNIPSSFLNLFHPSVEWKDIIGPSMDFALKAKADIELNEIGYLDIVTNSSNLHFKTRLNLGSHLDLFNPLKPSVFECTLSPKGFSGLKKVLNAEFPQEIKYPLNISARFIDLFIPLKKEEKEQGRLKAQFQTSSIEWEGKMKDSSFSIEGKIESLNLMEKIEVLLQANFQQSSPLLTRATFFNFLSPDLKWPSVDTMDIEFSIEAPSIPTVVLDDLFFFQAPGSPLFSSLFGKELFLKSEAKISYLSGPLKLFLKGAETQLSLEGFLEKGVLKLQKDLETKMKITPDLQKFLQSKNISFLEPVIEFSDPVSLSINAEGFSFSLYPPRLENFAIGQGKLSLEKVLFRNTKEFNSLFSLLKPLKQPSFLVWFTPLYFSVHNGTLTLERIDFLISNTYALALWGKLNLLNLSGPFYLGVPSNSFQYLFKIMQFESQELFVIPFLVEKGNIKTDNKKITQKISMAVLKMQSESQVKALGNLFHLLLRENSEENTPKPTTNPLPWESSSNSSSSSPPSKKKNEINLIQDLGKGASKALKRLFN